MISKKMEKALNKQVNMELYSAYIYAAMAADLESKNLEGMAHWMEMQMQEEMLHAQRIYRYINEAGGRVTLDAIDKPPADYDSPAQIFEAALGHERKVTASINKLVDLARAESDHATEIFLQWFVTEQVEEEAHADGILRKLKMVGNAGHGIFMIDRELGARVAPSVPAAEAE